MVEAAWQRRAYERIGGLSDMGKVILTPDQASVIEHLKRNDGAKTVLWNHVMRKGKSFHDALDGMDIETLCQVLCGEYEVVKPKTPAEKLKEYYDGLQKRSNTPFAEITCDLYDVRMREVRHVLNILGMKVDGIE